MIAFEKDKAFAEMGHRGWRINSDAGRIRRAVQVVGRDDEYDAVSPEPAHRAGRETRLGRWRNGCAGLQMCIYADERRCVMQKGFKEASTGLRRAQPDNG